MKLGNGGLTKIYMQGVYSCRTMARAMKYERVATRSYFIFFANSAPLWQGQLWKKTMKHERVATATRSYFIVLATGVPLISFPATILLCMYILFKLSFPICYSD